mmetsp:Transcript_29796/g.69920  ORF Transcript_29796/g.69920 Transcript_29796/m.69920 type:complete len:245 (+) Transcript_29796:23-757(+)
MEFCQGKHLLLFIVLPPIEAPGTLRITSGRGVPIIGPRVPAPARLPLRRRIVTISSLLWTRAGSAVRLLVLLVLRLLVLLVLRMTKGGRRWLLPISSVWRRRLLLARIAVGGWWWALIGVAISVRAWGAWRTRWGRTRGRRRGRWEPSRQWWRGASGRWRKRKVCTCSGCLSNCGWCHGRRWWHGRRFGGRPRRWRWQGDTTDSSWWNYRRRWRNRRTICRWSSLILRRRVRVDSLDCGRGNNG